MLRFRFALGAALAWFGCQAPAPAGVRSSAPGTAEIARGDRCASLPEAGPELPSSEKAGLPAFFPRTLAGFCLDPHAAVHVYATSEPGAPARARERVLGPGIDDAAPGREQLIALRYVAANGSGDMDLIASRFEQVGLAYAHFTQRLLDDEDPARLAATPIDAPGSAALDGTFASAWRGRHVLWLRYSDEGAEPAQELSAAQGALTAFAQAVLAHVPAETGLPQSVSKLPKRARIPLATRWLMTDALGVPGLGNAAVAHYAEGDKRWRVLAVVRPDAESAKDVISTLRRHPRARKIKGAPLDALELTEKRLPSEPHVRWVIGQRAEMIYGIGDDPSVLPEYMPARAEESIKLNLHDKLALLTKVHRQ